MIVTPKTEFDPQHRNNIDPESIRLIPGDDAGLMIECETLSPPSQVGKTVYLYVKPAQILAVMKAARRAAEQARMQPLSTSIHAAPAGEGLR